MDYCSKCEPILYDNVTSYCPQWSTHSGVLPTVEYIKVASYLLLIPEMQTPSGKFALLVCGEVIISVLIIVKAMKLWPWSSDKTIRQASKVIDIMSTKAGIILSTNEPRGANPCHWNANKRKRKRQQSHCRYHLHSSDPLHHVPSQNLTQNPKCSISILILLTRTMWNTFCLP